MKPDPLASLGPLFTAERERLVGALEAAARSLPGARGGRARAALFEAMARDAHTLKGVAALETRGQLADLVAAFEDQLEMSADVQGDRSLQALLLSTLEAIRQLERERRSAPHSP